MPSLPWKKTRVTRISQFVAGLQSPKRGGSLVVETGFPTSLIDLFVKNRDHLRKPSRKNKKKNTNNNRSDDDQVNDQIAASSEMDLNNSASLTKPSKPKVENLRPEEVDRGVEADGFRLVVETHVEDRVVFGGEFVGGNWNAVVVAVLKMFMVVVLALSTKKLAVGITLSAFLLLLLEYAGKHLSCVLKPCSNAKFVLRKVVQKVSAFLLFPNGFDESDDVRGVTFGEKKGDIVFELVDRQSESKSWDVEEVKCGDEDVGGISLIELLDADYEKMKVADKGSVCVDQTAGERKLVELFGMDYEKKKLVDKRREVCAAKTVGEVSLVKLLGTDYEKIKAVKSGEDASEFVADKKSKGSKNSKIKSKLIKKFVPKKLRRKGKQTEPEQEPAQYSEVSGHMGDDEVKGCEEVEENRDVKHDEQESENRSVLSLDAEEKSEIGGFDGVSDHGEGSLAGGETPVIVESKGKEGDANFGYLILFLIVLAGLFGGRIVALMLTITCCFMSKLIGTVRRWVKVCP